MVERWRGVVYEAEGGDLSAVGGRPYVLSWPWSEPPPEGPPKVRFDHSPLSASIKCTNEDPYPSDTKRLFEPGGATTASVGMYGQYAESLFGGSNVVHLMVPSNDVFLTTWLLLAW